MNYKEQEMVERLKDNWVVVGGLTLDEKVFLEKHIRSCIEIDIYGRGEEAELPLRIGSLVRLSPDFQLPAPEIEAPAGYRIVSLEDRKRCKFPVDCEVKYTCCGNGGWVSPEWKNWRNDEPDRHYAVPADYVFAEDRVKVPVKVEPVPVVLECPCCHAHFELKG
jgi:hypothetical protein